MTAGGTDRLALFRTWSGAVLISFSAVWVRLADVEAVRSSFLRLAYALPVFLLLIAIERRREGATPWVAPVAILAGALLGGDLLAWHASIGEIGAGLGTVLPNLQIVFVGVIGVLVFRERPARSFWIALPIVLAGVWLLGAVGRPIAGGSVAVGVALGVVTAAFYSLFLVVLRVARMRREGLSTVVVMGSATLGGAIVTGVAAGLEGVAGPVGVWPADGWLLALALGSQVAGWMLLTSSIHQIPAALTSVALLLQPVLAIVWGAVLLDEPIGVAQLAGAAVVLVGVVIAHRAVVRGAAAERSPVRTLQHR